MYVKQTTGGWLADREAIATLLGLSTETIRKRVPVVGRLSTGVALHSMEQASLILDGVRGRRRVDPHLDASDERVG